jgi:AraC-like DNA-binding protein
VAVTTAPSSAPHLVGPLMAYARDRGVRLAPPASRMTAVDFGAFFDHAAEALDEPHLGLLLPTALQFPSYELPELAARSSATLREAMERLTRYAPTLGQAVRFSLDEQGETARFTHQIEGHPRGVSRHVNEFAMAMAMHQCHALTGTPLQVREVRFINARPGGDLEALKRHFATSSLRFGHAQNALCFDAKALDAKVLSADPRLLATVETLAEAALGKRPGGSFSATLEQRVRTQLEAGELDLRRLAVELHMSTRTLQRRLEAEGTRYAELVDSVREGLARELVAAQEPSLSEVAFRLGFSEFATFSRAFKRWTGSAPGAFRAGLKVE